MSAELEGNNFVQAIDMKQARIKANSFIVVSKGVDRDSTLPPEYGRKGPNRSICYRRKTTLVDAS